MTELSVLVKVDRMVVGRLMVLNQSALALNLQSLLCIFCRISLQNKRNRTVGTYFVAGGKVT